MTNTQNLTRAEAEAAARAGAKVRHEGWHNDWVEYRNGGWFWASGNSRGDLGFPFMEDGWHIVTPAPDAGQPDTAKGADEWPERLVLRDTKITADEGQRIYTTATGYGYEKREYVRADIVDKPDIPPAFTTTRKTPPDDVPGEVSPFADRLVIKARPQNFVVSAPAPWRPTIGRDAVTRDGRRARNVRAYDGALAATVGEGLHEFYPAYLHDGTCKDGASGLDLTGDWIEPATNPHPEGSRKWAKFEMRRGRKVAYEPWLTLGEAFPYKWIEWAGDGWVRYNDGTRAKAKRLINEGWQLVGDDQ